MDLSYLAASIAWIVAYALILWPKTVDYLWSGMLSAMEIHMEMRNK